MKTSHYTDFLPFLNTRVSQKKKALTKQYSLLFRNYYTRYFIHFIIKLGRKQFSPTVAITIVINSKSYIFQQATMQPNPTVLIVTLHAGKKKNTKKGWTSLKITATYYPCLPKPSTFPYPVSLFCFESLLKDQNNLSFLSILIIMLV